MDYRTILYIAECPRGPIHNIREHPETMTA